jgi:hypothetical protein
LVVEEAVDASDDEFGHDDDVDRRIGLLALDVTFSAGIHAALVPEHLEVMPPLGYAFVAAAVLGAGLPVALTSRPTDRRLHTIASASASSARRRLRDRHPRRAISPGCATNAGLCPDRPYRATCDRLDERFTGSALLVPS